MQIFNPYYGILGFTFCIHTRRWESCGSNLAITIRATITPSFRIVSIFEFVSNISSLFLTLLPFDIKLTQAQGCFEQRDRIMESIMGVKYKEFSLCVMLCFYQALFGIIQHKRLTQRDVYSGFCWGFLSCYWILPSRPPVSRVYLKC